MKFDTLSFLQDFNVQYIEHSSTLTSAYIGIETCPFCGASSQGNKVYFAMRRESNSCNCWICHSTDFYEAVQRLTGITNYEELKKIYSKYGSGSSSISSRHTREKIRRPTTIDVPGDKRLIPNAKKFLEKRNFDAEYLWQKYDLRSTTFSQSPNYRIIIPITYNNKIISYTARDYTGIADPKFISCAKDLEIIPHKDVLYGADFSKTKNICVVEGPPDQWRVGDGAVATFGTEVTLQQLILLASKYDNIFFLFDGGESEALRHAYESAHVITSIGKNAEVLEMDWGDPDERFQNENDLIYLKKDLQIV